MSSQLRKVALKLNLGKRINEQYYVVVLLAGGLKKPPHTVTEVGRQHPLLVLKKRAFVADYIATTAHLPRL